VNIGSNANELQRGDPGIAELRSRVVTKQKDRLRSGAEREAPCESADVESMDPAPDHSGTDPCDPPPTRDGQEQ